ncbi:hypothetical protein FKP32DRAFT_1557817, partial [Trametes sanguinea]
MISCTDIERICSALSKAFNTLSESFGGKNVIFAGDFAQLQPAGQGKHSLYSPNVGITTTSSSSKGQRAALGKAIWHTFTTVVILRQNMRQTGMCSEDIAFRTALSNMRYGRCTNDDINLLNTRVHSPAHDAQIDDFDRFADVAVITARNAHRDAINEDKVRRFAARHGHDLHLFHSKDSWGKGKKTESMREAQRLYDNVVDPVRSTNTIGPKLQNVLWSIPHALSEHHAGILPICKDMPVLLKINEATELGATNGAPGRVYGWDSHTDKQGREYLDVLFIRLSSPPHPVQVDGLPPNVIPVGRHKLSVTVTLPVGDIAITIQREQVPCLPNFAMTDFTCQGLTLTLNVIHPRYCSNHQSLYTVLSRSSSLRDTVILEGFDRNKIQRGCSPALLQEF